MSTLTDMVDSYLTPNLKEGETIDLSQFTPRQRTNIRLYGLEFKDYTAIDIANYKSEWMKNCEKVDLPKGNRVWARKFCRTNFNQDYRIRNNRYYFHLKSSKMQWYLNLHIKVDICW